MNNIIGNTVFGYSKAMYSTWFFHKPEGILFDCGEGASLCLNSSVYAVDNIFLSHGHLDHIMGLPGFFFIRSASKGDNAKPLKIYYPAGDKDILRIIDFINDSFLLHIT